ncbi:MAG: hypothetical protein ACRD3M_01835, partial [Thermoanaerobaculia bacterium]
SLSCSGDLATNMAFLMDRSSPTPQGQRKLPRQSSKSTAVRFELFDISETGLADLIADLESAIAWVSSRGVRAQRSRYATYLRTIRQIEARRKQGATRAKDIPVDPLMMENAFREALQLARIAHGLRDEDNEHVRDKLRVLIGGPALEGDEKEINSGNRARNCAFELDVAACLAPIARPDFSTGVDVTVRHSGVSFLIECKRTFSLRKLATNLRDAGRQITEELEKTGLAAYGVVALSAAKMHWHAGALIRTKSFMEIDAAIHKWIGQFDRRHVNPWLRRQGERRLAGVLVHLPYTAYVGDSPTVVGTQFILLNRYGPRTIAYSDLSKLFGRVQLK